jgi:hypothetical protein
MGMEQRGKVTFLNIFHCWQVGLFILKLWHRSPRHCVILTSSFIKHITSGIIPSAFIYKFRNSCKTAVPT